MSGDIFKKYSVWHLRIGGQDHQQVSDCRPNKKRTWNRETEESPKAAGFLFYFPDDATA